MINFRTSNNFILRQNPYNSNNQTSFKKNPPTQQEVKLVIADLSSQLKTAPYNRTLQNAKKNAEQLLARLLGH